MVASVFFPTPHPGAPPRCRLCHQPVTSGHGDVCDRPLCQTRLKIEATAETARRKEAKEAAWRAMSVRRTRKVLRQAAKEIGVPHLGRIAHGLAPYIDMPQVSLSESRRAAFVAHLNAVLDEGFDDTDGVPTPPETDPQYTTRLAEEAPEPMVLNAACIACQGDCCLMGGDRHAFLTVETIRCQRWKDPSVTKDELQGAYLSRIPETSTVGSCVYHGSQGCTLDRPLRADICNSFQCPARRDLAKAVARRPGTGAVVAGLSKTHVSDPSAGAPYLRVVSVTEAGDVTVHDHLRLPALRNSRTEG